MNPLISDFIMMAKFIDFDPDILAVELECIPAGLEPFYVRYFDWAGGEEALVLMLAYAHTMGFHCAEQRDNEARMLVRPYWDRIVAEQPALSLEWFEPERHYFEDGSDESGLLLWKC